MAVSPNGNAFHRRRTGAVDRRSCHCGDAAYRIVAEIEGRIEDVLEFPRANSDHESVAVHPNLFHELLGTVPAAGWQVIQTGEGVAVDFVGLFVELTSSSAARPARCPSFDDERQLPDGATPIRALKDAREATSLSDAGEVPKLAAPTSAPRTAGSSVAMSERTPFQVMVQTALGFGVARCLHVAAELGVADRIGDQPATGDELGRAVSVGPWSLKRLMRVLCDHGIFQLSAGGFSHTSTSRLLRSDHPQSLRSYVRMIGLPWFWGSYQHLEDAVTSGKPALGRVIPEGIWAHLAAHPEQARLFNEAMTGKAQADIASVLGSYDFSRFRTVADIGGGRGHLLAAILEATPGLRGVLFDLPRVIEAARELAGERLMLQPGDFFEDELPVCDAYLMMEVIHDWNDADATRILSAVRRAAPAGAKLLVVELLIPETIGPNSGVLLDVAMMTLLGGKQRTSQEYGNLYSASGFRLDRVITTHSDASIIEGAAV